MIRDILKANYRAHEVLVSPARERAEVWRLIVGVVFVFALMIYMAQSLSELVLSMMTAEDQAEFRETAQNGSTPMPVLLLLFQLGLLVPATAIVCLFLHKRGLRSLIGPFQPAFGQFLAVFLVQIGLAAVLWALPPYSFEGESPQQNLAFGHWLALLPLSLMALSLQCAGEEVLFRGYIQQQLAARFRPTAIWLLLPSLLFAAGHYLPGLAGENALAIAVWAGVFGFLMADLTARAGTLGPAIAVHLVNNFSALLLFAPNDDMYGLSLYTMPFGYGDIDALQAWLLVDLVYMVVCWLAARLVIRR